MPAISRPILIALVGAVVALVAFYATRGGQDSTKAAAPPPAEVATSEPAPAKTAPVAKKDAPRGKPAKRGKAGKRSKPASHRGVPPAMTRALDARKLVVLFLYERRGADDRATARAVAALRGKPGVAVFSDPIGRLARYREVIGTLGIAQAPAIVIVGRDGDARVIEGYVDPATLAQDVADSR